MAKQKSLPVVESTLTELTGEYLTLYEMLSNTDPDDEEAQAITDTLEAVTGEIGIKADAYAVIHEKLLSAAEIRKKMGQKLLKSAKALENNDSRLKERLKFCMEQMGATEIEGDYFTFRIQKNGGVQTLKIREGAEVPQCYKKVIVENDNEKIREALEAGEELDFAYLEERGTHLRIS